MRQKLRGAVEHCRPSIARFSYCGPEELDQEETASALASNVTLVKSAVAPGAHDAAKNARPYLSAAGSGQEGLFGRMLQ